MKYVIRKFAYLKTPIYTWSAENEAGGSFSNSGNQKSERAAVAHLLANAARDVAAGATVSIERFDVDGNGNETHIKTLEVTK
jgi:hypothetical protein